MVRNEFEADGDLSRIYGKANPSAQERTYANAFTYTADGKIEKLRLGNGRTEWAKFNERLQVTELALGNGVTDSSLWDLNYEYGEMQTVSSVPNFTLPPINRLGLALLQRMDEKDYVIAALPEKSKKKAGFRITSPEGYYTDFFVDEKTGQVKSYEASYDFNGRNVTTSVEIDTFKEVDGIKIPEKYAQRFELGFATIYADFKAKEILVNSEVSDDVFSMAK